MFATWYGIVLWVFKVIDNCLGYLLMLSFSYITICNYCPLVHQFLDDSYTCYRLSFLLAFDYCLNRCFQGSSAKESLERIVTMDTLLLLHAYKWNQRVDNSCEYIINLIDMFLVFKYSCDNSVGHVSWTIILRGAICFRIGN